MPNPTDVSVKGKIGASLRRKSSTKTLLRQLAMAAVFTVPVAAQAAADESASSATMAPGTTADEALAELIRRTGAAASAYIRGDINQYLSLISHADDYTLMQPFGGAPTHGFDSRSERLAEIARYFKGGEANLELVQSYASGDLVVLVMIERQHGEVGGLPDQDWSLRVTQVYRRQGSEWQLVHRHADPLVHGINLEQAAALARG